MNKNGCKVLDAIKRMAADNNKGLRMTTTLVDVKDEPRGSIVGFGTEKVHGDDAKAQTMGLPDKYLACAFFIYREELKALISDPTPSSRVITKSYSNNLNNNEYGKED